MGAYNDNGDAVDYYSKLCFPKSVNLEKSYVTLKENATIYTKLLWEGLREGIDDIQIPTVKLPAVKERNVNAEKYIEKLAGLLDLISPVYYMVGINFLFYAWHIFEMHNRIMGASDFNKATNAEICALFTHLICIVSHHTYEIDYFERPDIFRALPVAHSILMLRCEGDLLAAGNIDMDIHYTIMKNTKRALKKEAESLIQMTQYHVQNILERDAVRRGGVRVRLGIPEKKHIESDFTLNNITLLQGVTNQCFVTASSRLQ